MLVNARPICATFTTFTGVRVPQLFRTRPGAGWTLGGAKVLAIDSERKALTWRVTAATKRQF